VRYDRILKEFYLRLRAAGKKPLVAITACMRKLVILMNHLLKNQTFPLHTEHRCFVEPNPNQIKVFANGHPLQPATSGAASSGRVIVAADVSRLISIRAD
jgi:hypothetical protein